MINYSDWTAFVTLSTGTIGGLVSMIMNFKEGLPTLPFIFLSLALVIFGIYRLMNWRKNKTFIDIDEQYMYIRNRPKNFQKDKTYLRTNIRQFYTKVYGGDANPTGYNYVFMIYDSPDGEEHVKVSPILKSKSRALYLEQELENFLNIPDERVPEETKVTKS